MGHAWAMLLSSSVALLPFGNLAHYVVCLFWIKFYTTERIVVLHVLPVVLVPVATQVTLATFALYFPLAFHVIHICSQHAVDEHMMSFGACSLAYVHPVVGCHTFDTLPEQVTVMPFQLFEYGVLDVKVCPVLHELCDFWMLLVVAYPSAFGIFFAPAQEVHELVLG